MKKTKTRQGIIQAFNAAIEGIIYTFKKIINEIRRNLWQKSIVTCSLKVTHQ